VKFAISGSYSASGRAAAPIFQAAKVVFISAYGVHPDIPALAIIASAPSTSASRKDAPAAKFIGETLADKDVSVISMDNDYGQATLEGFKSAARQFGVNIVGEYHYPLRDGNSARSSPA